MLELRIALTAAAAEPETLSKAVLAIARELAAAHMPAVANAQSRPPLTDAAAVAHLVSLLRASSGIVRGGSSVVLPHPLPVGFL